MTPNKTLLSLLLHGYNFATVIDRNVNMEPRGVETQAEHGCSAGAEQSLFLFETGSHCAARWGAHYAAQAGLELRDLSASVSMF